jgi:hypothetical protein
MTEKDSSMRRAAAEVLELGEMLFDTTIDTATQHLAIGEEHEALLLEEMRAAADDFFMALRLLLEAEYQETEADLSAPTGSSADRRKTLHHP